MQSDLPSGGAISPGTRYGDRVPASGQGETTTVDLKGQLPFPDPVAALSLRDCAVFRGVDDDNQPVLILSDGVTTLFLECGLRGASEQIVAAANRVAEGVHDFATSVESSFL